MKPGAIIAVNFPFSAHQSDPYKVRPVLVLNAIGEGPDQAILCAMITSSEQRVRRPRAGDVVILDHESAGLPRPSVVRCRRIWTAERRDTTGRQYGTLSDVLLAEVRRELAVLIGLEQ